MATHSSVRAWRIPGTVGPGGLLSMGLHRVGYDWSDLAVAVAARQRSLNPGKSVWTEWKNFKVAREKKNSWFVIVWAWTPRRQSMQWPYIHWTGIWVYWNSWQLGAGAWRLEGNPGVRIANEFGELAQGDGMEEICSRKCLLRKAICPWDRVLLLSHEQGLEHSL